MGWAALSVAVSPHPTGKNEAEGNHIAGRKLRQYSIIGGSHPILRDYV
jgi:hypothetical protein